MVGAIGPLDTLRDRQGSPMLLPQYFSVLPEHHGHGHGCALWRAAANWGRPHGAAYQLLQTQLGQASDQLFLSEGLHTLGFATTVPAYNRLPTPTHSPGNNDSTPQPPPGKPPIHVLTHRHSPRSSTTPLSGHGTTRRQREGPGRAKKMWDNFLPGQATWERNPSHPR